MSEELSTGLAATANQPTHDTQPTTIDSALDAAFDAPAEGSEPSDPSTPTEPVKEATADATVQPQATTVPKPETGAQGAPPPEKWEHILENTRRKSVEEALAKYRDAKTGVDLLSVAESLRSDFSGTLSRLLEEAADDPQLGDTITAKAAALLNARKQRAKADEMPQPDQSDDKYVWYSPEQQQRLDAWKARQIKGELLNEFKPLLELKEQYEQHKQAKVDAEQAAAIAEERGAEWKNAPMFSENKDAIIKRQAEIYGEMKAAHDRGERRMDPVNAPWQALQRAYFEVLGTQALPKLQTQQTQKLLDTAAHKRAGSASDPAASLPATPRKPRTPDEALDQVFDGAGV